MVIALEDCSIVPHGGVGRLLFGLRPDAVHLVVGVPSSTRGPSEFSDSTSEYFNAYLLSVEFDREGSCCSIEMAAGATLTYEGANLMVMSYRRLVELLRRKGARVVEAGDGFRCDDLGLACYAPRVGDPTLPDPPIDGILIYRRGYYE